MIFCQRIKTLRARFVVSQEQHRRALDVCEQIQLDCDSNERSNGPISSVCADESDDQFSDNTR